MLSETQKMVLYGEKCSKCIFFRIFFRKTFAGIKNSCTFASLLEKQ